MRHNRPEVRVVTRFKPLSEDEKSHNKNKKISAMCVVFDQQNIEVLDRMHQSGAPPSAEFAKNRSRTGSINEMAKNFTMDEVFSDKASQADLFERVGRPIVKNVVKGYNGTLLAYGQTGSGKTHSMIGPSGGSEDVFLPDSPRYNLRGLIPRMVDDMFRRLNAHHRSERKWGVSVSIFEIYKEEIIDLLAHTPTQLNAPRERYRIREDSVNGKGIYIESLERPETQSSDEVIALIQYAANKRKTAVTNINETSSRSHSLVILYLEQMDYTNDPHGQRILSRLNLVDLAGSEKVHKTLADGERLQEAKNINLSLTLLGNVIYKLTDGKSGYVPYRDSKLTRILQESLGGNSITTLICHCSIAMYNREETLSTLRFAQRAKRVRNKPQINKDLSAKELKLQLVAAEQKIETLEEKLRVKSDIIAKQRDNSDEQMLDLQALVDSLMREIEQLREELQAKDEELEHEKARAELYKRQAEALAADLEKERKKNETQTKSLGDALKASQAENEQLQEQLAALMEELAKPQNLNLTPRKEPPPVVEEKAKEEEKTPSPPPPLQRAVSAPFDRTTSSTVETQSRDPSMMLGKPHQPKSKRASHSPPPPTRPMTNTLVFDESDGKVCPSCGYHLPQPVTFDAATNTAGLALLLANEDSLHSGSAAQQKDPLRQLGGDEVGRSLHTAGNFIGAMVGDTEGAAADGTVGDGHAGAQAGSGLPTNREVLDAVGVLEQVLHVIAEAIENDQLNTLPDGSPEEQAAAHDELKNALQISERVLAAWRESEGNLNPVELVDAEKKKQLELRQLSKAEKEKFKEHEAGLVAAEVEAMKRRLHRQVVAEELATADKGNMLGRQELQNACAEEQQKDKEILKPLPARLVKAADAAAVHGEPIPKQQAILERTAEGLAKALEEFVARGDEHLKNDLQQQLRKENNTDAASRSVQIDKDVDRMLAAAAQRCDNVVAQVLSKNEPVTAEVFEKLAADLKKDANAAIEAMYKADSKRAKDDQKAAVKRLEANAKEDGKQLHRGLDDIVDAAAEKLALQLQSAGDDSSNALSAEEIRAMSGNLSKEAKQHVEKLCAAHDAVLADCLESVEKDHNKYVDQEMADREEKMKKNVGTMLGAMVAKMQVLAMHEQLAPSNSTTPMTSPQLDELTEQLKRMSNPELFGKSPAKKKEESRRSTITADHPRVTEPIQTLSEKVLEESDACMGKATGEYGSMTKEAVGAIGASEAKHMNDTLQDLPRDVATAEKDRINQLSEKQAKAVAKALEDLSRELGAINSASQKERIAAMEGEAEKELKKAQEVHHVLSEKEAEQLAATLAEATAAGWNDLLTEDSPSVKNFMEKIRDIADDSIENICEAHRDLSEEQQKALTQQLQRQHMKEQQAVHQKMMDTVDAKMDALEEELRAIYQAEGPQSVDDAAAADLCDALRVEAMEQIAVTEKSDREMAGSELADVAARQALLAAEEKEVMKAALDSIADRELSRMEDRISALLVENAASEQRSLISQEAFTPQKLNTLSRNLSALLAAEAEDQYSMSLRSVLSQQVKEAAAEEGDAFFVGGMKVAAAQHDMAAKASCAQCAKDVCVLRQKQIAMGGDNVDQVPEKLAMLMQAEVGDDLSPAQERLIQDSMNALAQSLMHLLEEDRMTLDKQLEALAQAESEKSAERHTSVSRANLKNLSGDITRCLDEDFQQLIDQQKQLSPQNVEVVVAKLQEMCNDNIAALCERHGRLSEDETRNLSESIAYMCEKDKEQERSRVEGVVANEIGRICHNLEVSEDEEGLTPQQITVLRGKMEEMAAREIGAHYDKKGEMTADEALALYSKLGEVNARSNVQLMDRLQAYASESVERMVGSVVHVILTASQEEYAEEDAQGMVTPNQRQMRPSCATAVVSELIVEEVANCMKESQMNGQEYAMLADRILELTPASKRSLATSLRSTQKLGEEPMAVSQQAESPHAISRQQYHRLSTQIEKLASFDSPAISARQQASPHQIEVLTADIHELTRPGFTLLCKRLEVQELESSPHEEVEASTARAIAALVNYMGAVGSSDQDYLTSAMIRARLDPATINNVLRVLNEAVDCSGSVAVCGEERVYRPLYAREARYTSDDPAVMRHWSNRVRVLCCTIEGAAAEEVVPNPVESMRLIEDRQPMALLRRYSEGRQQDGAPLSFMAPVCVQSGQVREMADNSEDQFLLADLNALQAAEMLLRQNLAGDGEVNAEEVRAAALTVDKVIERSCSHHPLPSNFTSREAMDEFEYLSEEERQDRMMQRVRQSPCRSWDEVDVTPVFFDSLVQQYLQQPDEVQDAIGVLEANENASNEERQSKLNDPLHQEEVQGSMQILADAVALVLDRQRGQILYAYMESEEVPPSASERGISAREANRVLWATQNLGASMEAENMSPSLLRDRTDCFPQDIQCASVAMRYLVNEAMVEPRVIESTLDDNDDSAVWRMLQRQDVQDAVRAFDEQAHEGDDSPIIMKGNSMQRASVPVVNALKLPSSYSERAQNMRNSMGVLDYGLNNLEGRQRIFVRRSVEHPLVGDPLPTSRDPSKKVLTRYGYAKSTRECGTMTQFFGADGKVIPTVGYAAENAETREAMHDMLTCMGVPAEEVAAIEEDPDASHLAVQRLRREVMFLKKAEEPSLRREIETRNRELACIFDAMEEMIEVVKQTSLDSAERDDIFAQRMTAARKGTLPDKLRDAVHGVASSGSDSGSLNSSRKDINSVTAAPAAPGGSSGLQRRPVNTLSAIPTKAMLADGSFDDRMNRKPAAVELRTLPTLEALVREPDTTNPAHKAITPQQDKAEMAPAEVAVALRETTSWMDEFQERYYELMKRYLESFGRAERLDELLDKSRNERDDSKQELDALKLVLDSIRKENQAMREVLTEMNVDMETYMSNLERQKRINSKLTQETESLKDQAAKLASTVEQQEFLEMGAIELAIRNEELEEIEQALEEVQNFYDPELIAKKRNHIAKGIRSIGTFCQKILSMCQVRPRFNTGTLESQRLNLLQGTAELYTKHEWAKEELDEQWDRQRRGVAR